MASRYPEAPSHWHPGRTMGSGSYGEAKILLVEDDDKKYLWKEIRDMGDVEAVEREVKMLMEASECSEFVIKFYDVTMRKGRFQLRFDYCEGGNLQVNLKRLTLPVSCKFTWQIASALAALHHANISHRDIKPHNIVLTSEDLYTADIRIIDFGLSKKSNKTFAHTQAFTAAYKDPLLMTHGYQPKPADVYSFGVMIEKDLFGKNGACDIESPSTEAPAAFVEACKEAYAMMQVGNYSTRWSIEALLASRFMEMCSEAKKRAVRVEVATSVVSHHGSLTIANAADLTGVAGTQVDISAPLNVMAHFGGYGVKLVSLTTGKVIFTCRTPRVVQAVAVMSETRMLYADPVGVWYVTGEGKGYPLPVQKVQGVTSLAVTLGGKWVAYTTPSVCKICKVNWYRDEGGVKPYLTVFTSNLRETKIVEAWDKSLVNGYLDVNGVLQICSYKPPTEVTHQGDNVAKFERQILEKLKKRNENESGFRSDLDRRRRWPATNPAMQSIPQDATLAISPTGRHVAVYIPNTKTLRILEYTRRHNSVSVFKEITNVPQMTSISFSPSCDVDGEPGESYLMVTCKHILHYYGYVYRLDGGEKHIKDPYIKLHVEAGGVGYFVPGEEGFVRFVEKAGKGLDVKVVGTKDRKVREKLTDVLAGAEQGVDSVAGWFSMKAKWDSSARVLNGTLSVPPNPPYPVTLLKTTSELVFIPEDLTKPALSASLLTDIPTVKNPTTLEIRYLSRTATYTVPPSAPLHPSITSHSAGEIEEADHTIATALSVALMDPALTHLTGLYDYLTVEPVMFPVRGG